MKKGFTLVELSIVLVIIGLLVGSILVAQSMIETASIQRVVRQIQQYDIAIRNFQTKYNSLPGDSKFFSTPGNGDGNVTSADGSIDTFDGEIANFWPDISETGFLNEGFAYTNVTGGGGMFQCDGNWVWGTPGRHNIPCLDMKVVSPSSYGNNTWTGGHVSLIPYSASGVLYYQVAIMAGWLNGIGRPLTYKVCLMLDKKIDDGYPFAGNMVLANYGAGTLNVLLDGTPFGGPTTTYTTMGSGGGIWWSYYPDCAPRIVAIP